MYSEFCLEIFLLAVVLVTETKSFPHARQVPYLLLNWIILSAILEFGTLLVNCEHGRCRVKWKLPNTVMNHKADNILVVLMYVLVTFSLLGWSMLTEVRNCTLAYNSRGAQSTVAGKAWWQNTKRWAHCFHSQEAENEEQLGYLNPFLQWGSASYRLSNLSKQHYHLETKCSSL